MTYNNGDLVKFRNGYQLIPPEPGRLYLICDGDNDRKYTLLDILTDEVSYKVPKRYIRKAFNRDDRVYLVADGRYGTVISVDGYSEMVLVQFDEATKKNPTSEPVYIPCNSLHRANSWPASIMSPDIPFCEDEFISLITDG